MLCKTVKYDTEVILDDVSITQVSEKLDFKSLLSRAAAGIIDLRDYQLPSSSDLVTTNIVSEEDLVRRQMDLLNEPKSIMNNLFGSSVEEAEAEAKRHMETMSRNRKPKEPVVDKPDSPEISPAE